MELNIETVFTIGLAASMLLGIIAAKLRLSPIIGYLLAGVMLGFFPSVRENRAVISDFAEIGVVLMMFGIGLKFHVDELLSVWKVAVPGAVIQCTFTTIAAGYLFHIYGQSWPAAIMSGMAICVASTVVMARVLTDTRDLHTQVGHITIGWAVVEDILTVMALLALPLIFQPYSSSPVINSDATWQIFAIAAGKMILLTAIVIALGKYVLPKLLTFIAETRSTELFTLSVLVLALGIAAGSSILFGVSAGLGAFLAGIAVGQSEFAARASGEAIPLRDAFAVLFFVSSGLMFSPNELISHPGVAIIAIFVVLVITPVIAALLVRLLGRPWDTAINSGAAFAQIGEFSFILGTVAYSLKDPVSGGRLITDASFNALIAAAIITTALNPFIYGWARKVKPRGKCREICREELPPANPNRCIIIGYGPVGKAVYGQIRQKKNVDIRIIELNIKTVQKLKEDKLNVVYGDALRPGILEEAGIIGAGFLALTVQVEDGAEIIKRAKQLNPKIKVIARRDFFRGASTYKLAGADAVAIGEAELANRMAEKIGELMPKD